jgi:hypothetical protein
MRKSRNVFYPISHCSTVLLHRRDSQKTTGYQYDTQADADVGRAVDRLEARGIFDRYDDDDDDDEGYGGIFEDILIPNPILDNIDPDGAAERFPELASDPKFWFEMFLFISFINFVSFIGPRNPFPDLPAVMSKAVLPPPGL